MRSEYLLFNILVLFGPIAASFEPRVRFFRAWSRAIGASALVAVPYLVWDALVTGHHWWFNDLFTLGIRVAGLPIEEILFFLTVPFACIFVWEVLALRLPLERHPYLISTQVLLTSAALPGAWFLDAGLVYTGIAFLALPFVSLADWGLRVHLLRTRRFWIFQVVLILLITLFNGYLTGRPVVLYNDAVKSGLHLFTIPLEDFLYGFGHITLVLIVYEWMKGRRRG